MASGAVGWVSSKLVKSEKHCLADHDFDILDGPPLAFSQQGAHGVVVVEATVETNGKVSATKVTQNTTDEPAMAKTAGQEIRVARFAPPMRNCTAKRFIYVYTRRF
jgi:Gram-negative bacterial tonB protein.